MISPERRRVLAAVAAIAGSFLVTGAAAAVEVEPLPIEGRTQAAIADFRSAMKLEPDIQRGAELYSTCAACHGAKGLGVEDGSVPAIAGQHSSVMVKQLVDFRHDRRWSERMREVASKHFLNGPQELLDVATYSESLRRWAPLEGGTGNGSALKEGYVAYHRDCAACHGPLGLGDQRRVRPRLAGQRYQYLLRQLEETADRMRPGMGVEHVKLIAAFSAEERRAVADYLSRLSPNLSSTQEQPRHGSAPTSEGAQLYRQHCAACHGARGHGDGPVAPIMAVAVPDLTRIAARRGGHFPEDEVSRIIDGLSPLAAHGTRHMPVWGYEFYSPEADDETAHQQATERVERLTHYLGSIQQTGQAQD